MLISETRLSSPNQLRNLHTSHFSSDKSVCESGRVPQAAHGLCRARNNMAATQRRYRRQRQRWQPELIYIYRARLGLVLQSCRRVPLGCMQGGSRCPGPAVEPERARWHDPVLGRWLGLTPERPALCLSRFPGRPRVALSWVYSDPPGLGRRYRKPKGRLGARYAKHVTICPTLA